MSPELFKDFPTTPEGGDASREDLFPALRQLVEQRGWLLSSRGAPLIKLQRILGLGHTRAKGLEFTPAPVERKQEYSTLKWPRDDTPPGPDVMKERAEVKQEIEALVRRMRNPDHQRRFALEVLHELEEEQKGKKDNQFYAGHFVLTPDKSGMNWSWGITRHYPIIESIPPDVDYVRKAFRMAGEAVDERILPPEQFAHCLRLAWTMARQFSKGEDVLIARVAQTFKIAFQNRSFWEKPARRNFNDVPEGIFIANLIQWRRQGGSADLPFDLVPATLNQTRGQPFYVPGNPEGTEVKPMIFIRRRKS